MRPPSRLLATSCLLAALALAACAPAGPAPTGAGPAAPRATRAPKAGAGPSATPAATGAPPTPGQTPAAPATPGPAPALARPAGAVRTVAGTVRIDAAYAVSTGGARILSNNGAAVVNAGGTVVSNNTGNLVSDGGGALIANNGGGLIASNGGRYALAQAGPTPAVMAPALGAIMPAAGLVLAVRSLRTGALLPLGADGAGRPVEHVLTNAQGGFELYVPAAEDRYVLEARFPAAAAQAAADPRLAYDLLPTGGEAARAALVIDEDTALVTRYVRKACRGAFTTWMVTTDTDTAVAQIMKSAAESLRPMLVSIVREFRAEATATGLDRAPKAELDRVAARATDALLAHVALDEVRLTHAYWPRWTGPEEPAIPALVDGVRQMREAATRALAADPAFFERQPYMRAIAAARPAGAPPPAIRKPADVNDLIIDEFLVPDLPHERTEEVFRSVGVDVYQCDRLYAAANNYIAVLGMLLFSDATAKADALAAVRAWRPTAGAAVSAPGGSP